MNGLPDDIKEARAKKYEQYLASQKKEADQEADATSKVAAPNESEDGDHDQGITRPENIAEFPAALDAPNDAKIDQLIPPAMYWRSHLSEYQPRDPNFALLMTDGNISPEDAAAIARALDASTPHNPSATSQPLMAPRPPMPPGKHSLECMNCRRGDDMHVSFFCTVCKTMVLKTLRAINMYGPKCSNPKCGKMNGITLVYCHVAGCLAPHQIVRYR